MKATDKYPARVRRAVRALKDSGHSWSTIADATGIPQGSLHYLARTSDWTPEPYGAAQKPILYELRDQLL